MKTTARKLFDITAGLTGTQPNPRPASKSAKQSDRANSSPDPGPRNPDPGPSPSSQGEQRSDLANTAPEAGRRNPEAGAAPFPSPYACIATTYLDINETEETRFYDRIAKQRREQEAMQDRLESKLNTLQQRRQSREDRQRQNAPTLPPRNPACPLPFQRNPIPNTEPALQATR